MKKRVICLLLCLCMAISLLPMAAFAAEPALESVTFGYAYDVQRSPAFPESTDSEVSVYNFTKPFLASGEHHTTNEGSWTLTKAGTFADFVSRGKDNYSLTGIVTSVASNYNVDAGDMVIHELKDGTTHVAYGVAVAYDSTNGYAIFLGDSLQSSAGYMLSKAAVTSDRLEVKPSQVVTDFVSGPEHTISLDVSGTHTFTAAVAGYAAQTAKTVTVKSTGSSNSGALTVALSGSNAANFTLSKTAIADLAAGATDTFTVVPNTGLAAGTYTATVSVSGSSVTTASFNVSFTVTAPSTTHTCTKCSICNRCLDTACTDSACVNKCLGLTMYFSDVNTGNWYYDGVSYVYHHGMMNGVGGNLFDVNGITNRAMLVTILWRLEGEPQPTADKTFADVPSDTWYTTAVRWAASNGIVEGYGNGYFGPEHKLTREEFATIFYRYANFKGYDVSNSAEIIYFVDVDQVSIFAVPALKWIYAEGIITGKTSVTLDPRGGATRAEAATILMRFCTKYLGTAGGGSNSGTGTGADTGTDTGSGNDYGTDGGDWGWG